MLCCIARSDDRVDDVLPPPRSEDDDEDESDDLLLSLTLLLFPVLKVGGGRLSLITTVKKMNQTKIINGNMNFHDANNDRI